MEDPTASARLRATANDHAPAALIVSPRCAGIEGRSSTRVAGDTIRPALWLMSQGYDPARIFYVMMNGSGHNYVLPRNVRWTDLPFIGKPEFDHGVCFVKRHYLTEEGSIETTNEQSEYDDLLRSRVPDNEGIRRTRRELREALPNVGHVVVQADGCDERLLWEALAPVHSRRDRPFDIRLWSKKTEEQELVQMPFDEVSRLEQKFRGHDRFLSNYMFNMLALGGRARYAAEREQPYGPLWSEGRIYNEDNPPDKQDPNLLSTPAALLLLQALVDEGHIADLAEWDDQTQQDFPRTTSLLPFFRRDDDRLVFEWAGTGKYPPISLEVGRWHDDSFLFGQKDSGTQYHYMTSSLAGSGFVVLKDGHLRASRKAVRYLDLLGSGMVDVDLLLRWRTEDGRIASEHDIPACDRWLQKKFRALKRRVSGLPASPFTEPGIAVDNPKNKLVVRGYKFDLSGLPQDVRKDIVAGVERTASGIPLVCQKIGIIRAPWQTFHDEEPTGLWIGVPLETMKVTQSLDWRFDENVDASLFDMELEQRLACLPRALAQAPREGPRYMTTNCGEKEIRRRQLRYKIEAKNRDLVGRLVYGRAVFIDDLHDWRFDGRLRRLGVGSWQGFEEGLPQKQSGLWNFGARRHGPQGLLLGRQVGLALTTTLTGRDSPYLVVPHEIEQDALSAIDTHMIDDVEVRRLLDASEYRLWCLGAGRSPTLHPVLFDTTTGTLAIGNAWQARNPPDAPIVRSQEEHARQVAAQSARMGEYLAERKAQRLEGKSAAERIEDRARRRRPSA